MHRTGIWGMMLVLAVLAFAQVQAAQAEFNLTADQMKAASGRLPLKRGDSSTRSCSSCIGESCRKTSSRARSFGRARNRSTSFNTSNTR